MEMSFAAGLIIAILAIVLLLYGYRKKLGGRRVPDVLRTGRSLPTFHAIDEQGQPLSSEDLRGQPAVILFIRGNWCPFCSRQVANLTKHYKEINDRGARLILLTPKPLETTRRVAQFFDVDFEFWLDEDLAIASRVGLVQTGGVPKDHRGEYGEDTMWPTSIVVDPAGVIRFVSVSRFIADRPDPQKFIQVLDTF